MPSVRNGPDLLHRRCRRQKSVTAHRARQHSRDAVVSRARRHFARRQSSIDHRERRRPPAVRNTSGLIGRRRTDHRFAADRRAAVVAGHGRGERPGGAQSIRRTSILMKASLLVVLLPLLAVPCVFGRKKEKPPSPADQQLAALLKEAEKNQPTPSAGSIFVPQSRLSDLARDVRAGQLHDLVNIVVNDQASAVSSGVTNTSRKSSANASITALAGQLRATGPWANLANLSGSQQIQGQGTTSRDSTLTTSLSAEVRYVFPNGNLL